MAERETILDVQMITDHSCGTYRIGEIDTLPDEAVEKHIERFGELGYTEWCDFFIRGLVVAANAMRRQRSRKAGEQCADEAGT